MMLFERMEKKVEIAISFINRLRDYAIKNGKKGLETVCDKALEDIKKI